MRLPALLLGALALTASCSSGWHSFRADGISVRYPEGWFATSRAMTPVTSPSQVLAVASYPLPGNDRGADGCEPKEALDRLPASGAFIYGWEYGAPASDRGFPPRPRHFALTGFARFECLGPSYMLRFRQGGRFFQIHAALGRNADPATRTDVLRILDSFRAARL